MRYFEVVLVLVIIHMFQAIIIQRVEQLTCLGSSRVIGIIVQDPITKCLLKGDTTTDNCSGDRITARLVVQLDLPLHSS